MEKYKPSMENFTENDKKIEEKLQSDLDALTSKLGYEKVSIKELGLVKDEIRKMFYPGDFKANPEKWQGFINQRKDGGNVRALVKLNLAAKGYVADIFTSSPTPVFFEDHIGNHDFNKTELAENLKNAIELPPYKK